MKWIQQTHPNLAIQCTDLEIAIRISKSLLPLIGRGITFDDYGVVGGWWICSRMFRHLISARYSTIATHRRRRHSFPVNFRWFSQLSIRESVMSPCEGFDWSIVIFLLCFLRNGSHALPGEWMYSPISAFIPELFKNSQGKTVKFYYFSFCFINRNFRMISFLFESKLKYIERDLFIIDPRLIKKK